MKGYFKNMKTITKVDFATYLGVILAFIVVSVCQAQGLVNRSLGYTLSLHDALSISHRDRKSVV